MAEQRILGAENFVKQVIPVIDDIVKKNPRLAGRRTDFHARAEKVSGRWGGYGQISRDDQLLCNAAGINKQNP